MGYNVVVVGNTATKILTQPTAGRSRKSAVFTNNSGYIVYIGFDSNVTVDTGFPLNQNDIWQTNEPRCYQGEVYGILTSGTASVPYQEIL